MRARQTAIPSKTEEDDIITSLSEMITSSKVAAIITDPNLPDNPIVDCNRAFLELTGYSYEEVLGRNCRFLSGAETEARQRQKIRTAISAQRPIMAEILNYRKDGTAFKNALMIAPIFNDQGNLLAFLGSQAEVPANDAHAIETRQRSAREQMQTLTQRQREVLFGMASGKLTKQIAYELDLSARTVKMHRAAALKALGIRTTAEAIRITIEAGYSPA